MKILQSGKHAAVLKRPAVFMLLSLLLSPAFGAVNQAINYQGFLVSKATNLAVDTPQAMKFVLHATAVGDTAQFTETRCSVPVSKGRYDVEIGSTTPGGIPSPVIVNSQNIWLEVQVSPDGNCAGTYEALQPRIKLQAAPYAFSSVYASTASAATTIFKADTIGALDVTTNGALTISTNLFVMGGISVGSISPGQKLSVNGVIQVTGMGNGFMFPDGTIQTTAVANTMWQLLNGNLFSVNPGNVGISTGVPQARLHVSTGVTTETVFLVTAGPGNVFSVDGQGYATASKYFGGGDTLSGVLRSGAAGDSMLGALTMSGSSITVGSPNGVSSARYRLANNVVISTTTTLEHGGVYISSHVFLPPGAQYFGDGSQLTGVISADPTKVFRDGDTMTGLLTLPSLTVTTGTFMVGGAALSVQAGSAAVNSGAYLARFTVGGGIIATSSITAQGNLYAPSLFATSATISQGLTSSTGTFTATGWTQYSLQTSSGIKVNGGLVDAPFYVGDGSQLTGVNGTDATRVLKAGDVMTGNLKISGSSMTISYAHVTQPYALTVSSSLNTNNYWLAVSTGGNVAIQYLNLNSNTADGAIRWSNNSVGAQGALGFIGASRAFAYRAGGSDVHSAAIGDEVFRISAGANGADWKFSIGTSTPLEKFHVGSNMLVSTDTLSPIFYVSTTTGLVGISTLTATHALEVNGGILAGSSITAQGGFWGDGSHITGINAGYLPTNLTMSNVSAASPAGVVFSSTVRMGVTPFTADPTQNLQVMGSIRVGAQSEGDEFAYLSLYPLGGPTYIRWGTSASGNQGILGYNNSVDLIYRAGASDPATGGFEVFRVQPGADAGGADSKFGIGTASPQGRLHVQSNSIADPYVFITNHAITGFSMAVSTSGRVGIGTPAAQGRLHVVSNSVTDPYIFVTSHSVSGFSLVVSTTGRVGIGTTSPQGRLHVLGNSTTVPYVFLTSHTISGFGLVVSTNGSVGVGTGRPLGGLVVSTAGQVGIGLNGANPKALLSVGDGNILAEGSEGALSLPVSGVGTRFMWIPTAGAIRAGTVTGASPASWDIIGNYSTAFGNDTQATGNYSVAIGQNNMATSNFASAVGGGGNEAGGSYSTAAGGYLNKVYGRSSVVSGDSNVVFSSYSWAGGYNNFLDSSSSGTFVWGYDDNPAHSVGIFNTFPITDSFVFLIDPANTKGYKAGIGTPSPQARLDVNGSAQFGAGVNKSTFTAAGFWLPRSMTTAELQAAGGTPPSPGAVAFNSSIKDLCVSTGSAVGQWALMGSKSATGCY